MFRILTPALLTTFSFGAAQAGEAFSPLEIAQKIFTQADSDGDGSLSQAEHRGAGLGRYGASFADFDLDSDGAVSLEEYKTVFERFHRGMDGKSA